MIKSYAAIALRHALNHKLYSAINVVGLAVGVACFILLSLFIRHELSFDRYHSKAERVYRISRDMYAEDGEFHTAGTPPVIAPLLQTDFRQIEHVARISNCGGGTLVANGETAFIENEFVAADAELLLMLDFVWLHGDPATALADPRTIVLTESTARKYFGADNPMGRTLVIENRTPLEVTGVIRDLPDNTHLKFDMLASMGYVVAVYGAEYLNTWNMNCYYTYVLLHDGESIGPIQEQAREFFTRHADGPTRTNGFTAIPLPDIHLSSAYLFGMRPNGSVATVLAAGVIAGLILLIACINFMNLATARGAQRAKEVGMRKVVGAERRRLVVQFLGEALLVTAFAMMLALALVELLLPAFSTLLNNDLTFDYLGNPWTVAALLLLTVLVGLGAGSYPAFYLSAFEPARVLKGDVTRGAGAGVFRKALVVLQFAISISLLIAAAIVYRQMQFAQSIELGYDKEQIVVVTGSLQDGLGSEWRALRAEWLAHPDVLDATASFQTPGSTLGMFSGVRAEGQTASQLPPIPVLFVDYGFFETYRIATLAGRTFSEEVATDRSATPGLVLSELAARGYGWTPAEAVGKWIEILGAAPRRGNVVGVVADVHFESVRVPIQPLMYLLSPDRIIGRAALTVASLRISGRNLEDTLSHIDRTWSQFVPNQPITRRFLDVDFEALYQSERRQGQVLGAFALLAVCIACLGLFGLASYTTERRTKEIGVRKVMGGTTWDIVRLLTAEIAKLVLLANVIAWPVAYLAMRGWLAGFAYRIDIGLVVFVGSALLALGIAVLTVGAVAARAAAAKPIGALRYE